MSQARLAVAVGVIVVALAGAAGLALFAARQPPPVAPATGAPPAAPAPAPAPAEQPAPLPAPIPQSAPVPPVADPPDAAAPDALLAELNQALPGLGVRLPARLIAAAARRDRLVLTFNPEFRPHLDDLSALDELTAALSARALTRGYRHLELRLADAHGRAVPLAELTATPPARRPRPEPIDDGVRR